MYEGFLDWVAKVRSANAPVECKHALELLTKLGENPVHDYRALGVSTQLALGTRSFGACRAF